MIIEPIAEARLYDLLMERELQFVRINEYEQKIEKLLGVPYEQLPVFDIPSFSRKRRKSAKKTRPKKRTIRRLKPDLEDAYLVEYKYNGVESSEILREYRLVQLLVKNDLDDISVLRISTVKFYSNNDYETVSELINSAG